MIPNVNRAFSASHCPGTLPQAIGNAAPLTLNARARRESAWAFVRRRQTRLRRAATSIGGDIGNNLPTEVAGRPSQLKQLAAFRRAAGRRAPPSIFVTPHRSAWDSPVPVWQSKAPESHGTLDSHSFSRLYENILLVKSKSFPITSAPRNRTAPHLLSGTVYLSNHFGSSQRPFRNCSRTEGDLRHLPRPKHHRRCDTW
jgi:hypothetical protein